MKNIFKNKQEIRNWIKEERKSLDIKALSMNLVEKIKITDEYKKAKNIMIFYPKEYEIDLLELLNDNSKNFYLPKINDKELLCCPYNLNDELCESCFKTKEPIKNPVSESILDLVIVPALAVDKNNYRLGYGGGFYDRFLKDLEIFKIVCLPKQFILETVFKEEHDIKIDMIISA